MNWGEIKAILRMGVPLLYREDNRRVFHVEYGQVSDGKQVVMLYDTDDFGKKYAHRVLRWEDFDQFLKSHRFSHVTDRAHSGEVDDRRQRLYPIGNGRGLKRAEGAECSRSGLRNLDRYG
jgi:hypothetical protein